MFWKLLLPYACKFTTFCSTLTQESSPWFCRLRHSKLSGLWVPSHSHRRRHKPLPGLPGRHPTPWQSAAFELWVPIVFLKATTNIIPSLLSPKSASSRRLTERQSKDRLAIYHSIQGRTSLRLEHPQNGTVISSFDCRSSDGNTGH